MPFDEPTMNATYGSWYWPRSSVGTPFRPFDSTSSLGLGASLGASLGRSQATLLALPSPPPPAAPRPADFVYGGPSRHWSRAPEPKF